MLHWLPIKARIDYTIAHLSFQALNSLGPSYLKDLVHPYTPSRNLRSCDSKLLEVPKTRLKQFGDRSFSKIGPSIWNSLPISLRRIESEDLFKKRLKTFLYKKYLT